MLYKEKRQRAGALKRLEKVISEDTQSEEKHLGGKLVDWLVAQAGSNVKQVDAVYKAAVIVFPANARTLLFLRGSALRPTPVKTGRTAQPCCFCTMMVMPYDSDRKTSKSGHKTWHGKCECDMKRELKLPETLVQHATAVPSTNLLSV